MGDRYKYWSVTFRIPIENLAKARASLHPCGHCSGRLFGEAFESNLRRLPRFSFVARTGLLVQPLYAAAHLDENLVAHDSSLLFIFNSREFLEELFKSDVRVHHNRLHLCE